MLDAIIHFSIKNKLIVGIFTIGLMILGGYSLKELPIDAVPDITNNQVQVITISPSLAAPDIERLITFPIEMTMSSIPQITELRSISRFGLSVITIVFEESTDIYWARQQVFERLQTASAQIPKGIGIPELAPITTGLGEIYQYTLYAKKGYESQYDAMKLREIQDWVVRRQLLGTEGVADVSSFGGFLKQYEVSLSPEKLRNFNVSIQEVFDALEKNNQNTGGSYLEKNSQLYFIRSEGLVRTVEDIENIVVKASPQGVPLLVKDVGQVRLGYAPRYGALTQDGQGEAVGGIVLMLKGANSSKVIENVKTRMTQIEKNLPEGVGLNVYLDRTKLVQKAIHTVTNNLIEGALIVIFVLVLLLGNLRAGFIVASVIPLSMLFAITLMNVFGVSGNLMSLGAIDFGLIVDGAVIIVEATLHHLALRPFHTTLTPDDMDNEVYQSAVKIRSSAAFGEIIILIVYLPILFLSGVEGKMFRPMAQTVSFAILGAFILSLTYVPMMCALIFPRKMPQHHQSFSERLVLFFQKIYSPFIVRALRKKWIVIISAVGLFLGSLWLFFRLGGEFIPTLDEGDFALEMRLLTGSSMTHTIKTVTKTEQLLLKHFPEVTGTVGKIGTAEIPTDPMPIEACDMMVLLKEKSEWTSASDKAQLAEQMAEMLKENVPEASFGFLQPIQMRFNELMTGFKQDVAIKIFGEDIDLLTKKAETLAKIAESVEGVKDIYVEKMVGMPQIVVEYDRMQLAKHGIEIETINQTLSSAFAGAAAGMVYENERRFDLVVRLDTAYRQDLRHVANLPIKTPSGNYFYLNQLANVSYKTGINQIQREDAKRRITVAFNVRGRDVESVVHDIQTLVEKKLQLPPGYFITYGGQFKNLEEAKARLQVAVPLALAIIFLLLFFTFRSIQQAILIFTAIPLSVIGGIVALWIRDMPFSISAGIGFIALFGVAVLNGIVLIAEFNHLEKEGVSDVYERIRQGTLTRLRPVLMTALVASLGFLPMAISQGAGAEVQKPLATVVIGGLVSATFLTLFVLPCLYALFQEKFNFDKRIIPVLLLGLFFASQNLSASLHTTTVDLSKATPCGLQWLSITASQCRLTDSYSDALCGSLDFHNSSTTHQKS